MQYKKTSHPQQQQQTTRIFLIAPISLHCDDCSPSLDVIIQLDRCCGWRDLVSVLRSSPPSAADLLRWKWTSSVSTAAVPRDLRRRRGPGEPQRDDRQSDVASSSAASSLHSGDGNDVCCSRHRRRRQFPRYPRWLWGPCRGRRPQCSALSCHGSP